MRAAARTPPALTSMANIVDLLIGLGINADNYSAGIAKAASDTDNFVSRAAGTIGPALAGTFAAAGVAAVGFAVTSVNAAGDFEAAVNNLAAVSGSALSDAGFSFDDVSAKALELGQTTAYSASQSIAAMTELVKGGVPIVDVMGDATAATLDLAAAGQVELANAAEIVSKQLGVWSDQGVTAADVSNLLAQAANASTVGVEELAAGLANVQGTAETVGVEYNELVQSMALLAPGFASASTAGTSLNNLLFRMQPTTANATAAMSELGLITADGSNVFFDAQGNFLGMGNAAEQLQIATEGLTEAEKTHQLQMIFGNDAMGAAVALAGAGAEGFAAMGDAMVAAGTAAEVAAIQNQGWNFAIDSMLGSIETLQIIIGTMLLPILTAFVNDHITPMIGLFSQFATAIGNGTIPLQTLFTVLTGGSVPLQSTDELLRGLASVFGVELAQQIVAVVTRVGEFIGVIMPLVDLISANLTPILVGLAAVAGAIVVTALYSMIAGFLAVAAPIAIAVAAAAAMYVAYQENFLGIQTLVNTVIGAISDIIVSVMATVQSFWAANGNAIMASAASAWATIQTQITNVVNAVSGVIQSVMAVVLTFWENNGASIMTSAASIWSQIQGIVTTVITLVSTVVTNVLNFLAGFINDHGAEIQTIFSTAWNFISGLVSNVLGVIQGIVNMVLGIITGDMETFDSGAQQLFEGLMGALETIFSDGLDLVQGLVTLAIDFILDGLGALVDDGSGMGRDFMQGLADGINAGISWIVDAAQSAAQAAIDAAKSILGISSPSTEGYWIGEMFMLGPITAIYDMIPQLETAATAMSSVLTDTATDSASAITANATAVGAEILGSAEPHGPAVMQNYDIDAHYTTVQDETTLRDTLRRQSILNAPRGI